MLRSTTVAKVLLLIRPKKGVETSERLTDLLNSAVFDRSDLDFPQRVRVRA